MSIREILLFLCLFRCPKFFSSQFETLKIRAAQRKGLKSLANVGVPSFCAYQFEIQAKNWLIFQQKRQGNSRDS